MGKGRGRQILVNKTDMPTWSETLDSFRTARDSWDLLHSHDGLETGRKMFIYVLTTQTESIHSKKYHLIGNHSYRCT